MYKVGASFEWKYLIVIFTFISCSHIFADIVLAKDKAPLSYDVNCTSANPITIIFCSAPHKYPDTGYELLASQLNPCESDCDLDWLGNHPDHQRNAENRIYFLSGTVFLMTHEDAPLGAYGGGDVTLYLIRKVGDILRFQSLKDDKGNVIGPGRGWSYDPEKMIVSFSPVTNSVGLCGRTFTYRFEEDVIKLKNLRLHEGTPGNAACSDVLAEIKKLTPEMIIKE